MNKETVLQKCTVEGNVVKLPTEFGQLDRKLYMEVKNAIEKIGGKWKGGKIGGFVFDTNPTELLNDIANGQKRNIKKEFQFFPTPEEIANWLVVLALIKQNDLILEPSAGQGDIIKAIHRVFPEKEVYCYELMESNQEYLKKMENVILMGSDFLDKENRKSKEKYDKIIANPPFSNNQDIDHIKEMYSLLADGGKLVSIASKHWQLSQNKKETEFRAWLHNKGAEVIELKSGSFKESGTNIPTCIIVIKK